MQKNVNIFKNFEEEEVAERKFYTHLTPEERISILETIRRRHQELTYGKQQGFRRIYRVVKQK